MVMDMISDYQKLGLKYLIGYNRDIPAGSLRMTVVNKGMCLGNRSVVLNSL